MQKKYLYIIVAIILIAVGVGLWHFGFLGGDRALYPSIKNNPALVALYDKAMVKEKEIKASPDKAALYFDLGLTWKSIAEQGGPEEFFNKSLAVYEQGIELFGQKNILFYLNAGNVAERVGDYAKAEEYFKKAFEISPADESGYLELAELYEYKLKKTKDEVVAVFKLGQQKLVNPALIVSARASYLRRQGDWSAALLDYKLLSLNFPANQGYKEIIAELEAKIKEGQK
jgi:tetratricopeptide (TPR) repeat protein